MRLPAYVLLAAFTAAAICAQTREPIAAPRDGFADLPAPSLEGVEPGVAEQVRAVEQSARKWVETSSNDADLAAAYFELGKLYHAYGWLEEAALAYGNVSRLAPQDYRVRHLLGLLEEKAGRLEQALQHYLAVGKLSGKYWPSALRAGRVLIALGRPAEARPYFDAFLRASPESASGWAAMGELELALKNFGSAVEALETARELAPDADRLHYLLGQAYRGAGEMDKAREELAVAGPVGVAQPDPLRDEVESLVRSENLYIVRGTMALRVGLPGEAEQAFRQALKADPESVPALVNLSAALHRQGRTAEAIPALRQALELDPENRNALFNLAALLQHQGDAQGGLDALDRLLLLDPADGEALSESARALTDLGKTDLAVERLRRAVAAAPDSEPATMNLAGYLTQLGRYEEAIRALEAFLAQRPEYARARAGLAKLLAAAPEPTLRDGKRAVELILPVAQQTHRSEHAATLALALAEMGQCQEAAEVQQAAIQTAPDFDLPDELIELYRQDLARYEAGPPCAAPTGEPEP